MQDADGKQGWRAGGPDRLPSSSSSLRSCGNAQRSTLDAQRSTRTTITTRPATHPPAALWVGRCRTQGEADGIHGIFGIVGGAEGDSLVHVIPNAVRDLEKGRECEVRSLTAFGMTGLAYGNAQRSTLDAQRSTRTTITTRDTSPSRLPYTYPCTCTNSPVRRERARVRARRSRPRGRATGFTGFSGWLSERTAIPSSSSSSSSSLRSPSSRTQ
jgi:hypothetical protein